MGLLLQRKKNSCTRNKDNRFTRRPSSKINPKWDWACESEINVWALTKWVQETYQSSRDSRSSNENITGRLCINNHWLRNVDISVKWSQGWINTCKISGKLEDWKLKTSVVNKRIEISK